MILNDFSFQASSMANDGYFIKPSSLKSCGAIILRLMPPENCFSVCVLLEFLYANYKHMRKCISSPLSTWKVVY